MEEKEIKIRAKDDELKGVYSNSMRVFHTKEEFVLDFFMLSGSEGVLASRVIMSPGHLKRTISALQDNIKKYEEKFGKVESAQSSESEIGFKV